MKPTPEDIQAEYLMHKAASDALVLLVEGGDDVKIYGKFIDSADVNMIPCVGKNNVLGALHLIEQLNLPGILAIVDSDFWHLDGIVPNSQNVLVTDNHDIEMMIVNSKSFDNLLKELTQDHKVPSHPNSRGFNDVRELVFALAKPLAYLRYYSHHKSLALKFDDLKHSTFIDQNEYELDLNKMVECVLALTADPKFKTNIVENDLSAFMDDRNLDQYQLVKGHDFTAILGVGLRYTLSRIPKSNATSGSIEKQMRICYDSDDFQSTELYQSAKQWEVANPPYLVFR